ncbi:rhomboid family intramembrane serine protease [Henriciella litoralis]|uniref:rhomboid family intramembrane serine protease n=1 Tax=Henriciella litoralis TaxID=568102 RepID=UPI000A015C2B|nr:rhomboid family intramembrane serine protease [Henriciella litoralis]
MPLIVILLTVAIVAASTVQLMSENSILFPRSISEWMFEAGAIAGGPDFQGVYRPLGWFAPLVLHVFLHGGIFHLAMNMTAMVAFGPPIAMAFGRDLKGALGFLIFFVGAAIAGALFQIGWSDLTGQSELAIGTSSALSGFLPAVGWIMGGYKQAIRMSVPWLLINIAIAVTGELLAGAVGIRLAWAAHIGGLAGGFVLFPLLLAVFNPRVWARIRQLHH